MVQVRSGRFSFMAKFAAAALLVALADILFFQKEIGSTLGLFAFAWTIAVAIAVPGVRRRQPSRIALLCAFGLSLALAFGPIFYGPPTVLNWLLFGAALFSAVLLSRLRFDDALRFGLRLAALGVLGVAAPLRDLRLLARIPRPHLRSSVLSAIAMLALPVAGAALFIALFASANPVIENFLPAIVLPDLELGRLIFWNVTFVAVWQTMRPARLAQSAPPAPARQTLPLPGVNPLSVTLSLITFNALFAVQNLLDLVFLWSGSALPKGMTMADYAHRGAYPLIVTALLAGAFVLIAAQPESEVGRRPLVRRLIVLWIAQNVFLVMSSVLRTLDYIDAYMLTALRIAALAWMALVATGLLLICWRMLKNLPINWLINANAMAALSVLTICSTVDLGAQAAAWNVRHAREVGGGGQPLDLNYLHRLGPSALVPLAALEQRPLPPLFHDRVAFVRLKIMENTLAMQSQPYGWSLRNARRLSRAQSLLGPAPYVPAPAPKGRTWDGSLNQPPTAP